MCVNYLTANNDNICVGDKMILVIGVCSYELIGLKTLLTEIGYRVVSKFEDEDIPNWCYDMTIVALSAIPLAGWSNYLTWIREVRQRQQGKLIILVPKQLRNIRLLWGVGQIYNGYASLCHLRELLKPSPINEEIILCEPQAPKLTYCQHKAMIEIYLRMFFKLNKFTPEKRTDYMHRASLLGKIGICRLQTLCLAGVGLLEDAISMLAPC